MTQLKAIEGLRVLHPQGAFYTFVDVGSFLPEHMDDVAFCSRFLEEHAVAAVPGTAFGAPGWVRMSLAVAAEDLSEAVRRLKTFLHGFN